MAGYLSDAAGIFFPTIPQMMMCDFLILSRSHPAFYRYPMLLDADDGTLFVALQ